MPGNMKCGRLRFSNCFVVFFPFLSSSPRSRFFVQLDPFLPFLSFHRSRTLQRISTCTIPRLSSCPLFLLLHFFPFLLLLSDSYSAFPDFFISSSRHSPPFVTSATSSCFFLCLVFVRFPLDYSIDPRNSLIVLSRVFSLFNLLIYECLANFFLKIFIFYMM